MSGLSTTIPQSYGICFECSDVTEINDLVPIQVVSERHPDPVPGFICPSCAGHWTTTLEAATRNQTLEMTPAETGSEVLR